MFYDCKTSRVVECTKLCIWYITVTSFDLVVASDEALFLWKLSLFRATGLINIAGGCIIFFFLKFFLLGEVRELLGKLR